MSESFERGVWVKKQDALQCKQKIIIEYCPLNKAAQKR
jgi:hypothetical protein